MPKIDPTKLTKEIKNKYSVVSNAFRLSGGKKEKVKDGKPKDLIITEVGDVKQEEFLPQVKIGRWGDDDNTNEVNFSVRLIDNEIGKETLATENDKIKWSKGNKTARFYEIEPNDDYPEGAFEFDIELAKKPKTNKIGFSLNIKGVDFYYQPPLTQEYQNGYSEEFKKEIIVTETDVKDLDGNVLVHRPDNVVGSYVPYASEQKTNWKDGKDYKVGKVGHIYRPEIFDASGASVWGILSIDKEAGKLTVEIPQEFLDKAVYPVVVDPTFGYTTKGDTALSVNDKQWGNLYTSTESGTVTKISANCYNDDDLQTQSKGGIFSGVDGTLMAGSGQVMITGNGVANTAWYDYALADTAITATNYYLMCIANDNSYTWPRTWYDDTGTAYIKSTSYAGGLITVSGFTSENKRYSIYATYTISAAALTFSVYDSVTVSETVYIIVGKTYSKGDYSTLPANSANLETAFAGQDYADVETKNDTRVAQTAIGQYAIYEFKDYVGSATGISLEWEGQTDKAPSAATVYLQIYNVNTTTWTEVDSDNSSSADTDFTLSGTIADLTNYKDGDSFICCRVYQQS